MKKKQRFLMINDHELNVNCESPLELTRKLLSHFDHALLTLNSSDTRVVSTFCKLNRS